MHFDNLPINDIKKTTILLKSWFYLLAILMVQEGYTLSGANPQCSGDRHKLERSNSLIK